MIYREVTDTTKKQRLSDLIFLGYSLTKLQDLFWLWSYITQKSANVGKHGDSVNFLRGEQRRAVRILVDSVLTSLTTSTHESWSDEMTNLTMGSLTYAREILLIEDAESSLEPNRKRRGRPQKSDEHFIFYLILVDHFKKELGDTPMFWSKFARLYQSELSFLAKEFSPISTSRESLQEAYRRASKTIKDRHPLDWEAFVSTRKTQLLAFARHAFKLSKR
jgi:hypothetical protein